MSRRRLLFAALLAYFIRAFYTQSDDVKRYPLPTIENVIGQDTVLKGKSALLHCGAGCDCASTTTPKVSWLENGRSVVADSNTYVSPTGVLHVKNCTGATSSRVFRCVAAVGNWSVLGIERRIHVIDPTTVSLSLDINERASIGDTTVMRCSSINKQPSNLSPVRWYKDNKEIQFTNESRYSLSSAGHLIIHSLASRDSGRYQCKVYIPALEVYLYSSLVNFNVGSREQIPPDFTFVSSNVDAAAGSHSSILCAATGNPIPFVSISRQSLLSGYTVVASGLGLAILRFDPVKAKDHGRYVCHIESGDVKRRRDVWLNVLSAPTFTSVPGRRKSTLEGYELSLTCSVSGAPKPTVTWYKDGKKVIRSDAVGFDADGTLTLTNTVAEHAGIYQCIATNELGSVAHSTFVFIEESLRPPLNVRARALSASSLNITWQLNPINNKNAVLAHILFYEYNTSPTDVAKKQKVIGDDKATSWVLDHLYGGTIYKVHLSTYGKKASVKSTNSEVVSVRTKESVPSSSPHPASAVNLGNKMVRVIWTPIPMKFANGQIKQYKVDYGVAGLRMKTLYVPANKTQIDIKNLHLGELYTIEVSAGTSAGFSEAALMTIKIGDPEIADEKGPAMVLYTLNTTAVRVHWRLTKSNYITGFILSYVPIITADYWHSVKIVNPGPDKRSYTIADLNPKKDYRIEIKIVSGPVQSKSSVIVHTAYRRAALPSDLDLLKISNPRDLECVVKDNTSVYLSWASPVHTDDIDHYTVQIELGGRTIEAYKTYSTHDLKYLLRKLSRGTWYYIRVNAVPKQERIDEVARKLKRKFIVPKYQSRVVACKTVESTPEAPRNVHCNVTRNGHDAMVTWYPPDNPHGLIVKYMIRYKRLVSEPRKPDWKVESFTMQPNINGYPLAYGLDVEYYSRYRIEVSAVNSAGEGPAAVIESCSLRRKATEPAQVNDHDSSKNDDSLMTDDTKLGIIVGCSVASFFIFTFVIVFVWKNPFRMKSTEAQKDDSSMTSRNGLYTDDFLYLQRLAELQNNATLGIADYNTRCVSNGRTKGDDDVNAALQPLMLKYHTAVELTGSSSGQPICTCTCLLHGRLRGQALNPRERRDIAAQLSKNIGDHQTDTIHRQSAGSSSTNSEDVHSAESADSRTQMLPKTSENVVHDSKDKSLSATKILQQIKKETTFQV